MSVEPWTAGTAAYGRFVGPPPRAELERFFYLDDADKRLVAKRRGDHNRLGSRCSWARCGFDDEPYRRDIKAIRNLQEGRHDLARTMFHGQKGELRHGYREGMEDQLGALGLILNTITL